MKSFKPHYQAFQLLAGCILALSLVACGEEEPGSEVDPNMQVEAGTIYKFDLNTTAESEATVMNRPVTSVVSSRGEMSLEATGGASDDHINWTVKSVLRVAVQSAAGVDTVNQESVLRYKVSKDGELMDVSVVSGDPGSEDQSMQELLQSAMSKQNAEQLFLNADWLEAEQGDTWRDNIRDTITADSASLQMLGAAGQMKIEVTGATQYRHAGIVDTMGQRLLKVEMTVDTLRVVARFESPTGDMEFLSNGEGTGTLFYSLDDRVLYHNNSTTVMETRMEFQGVEVPLVQRVTSTITRR